MARSHHPLLLGFPPWVLLFAVVFGVPRGLIMGVLLGGAAILPFAVAAGLLFGVAMGGCYRWKARRLGLGSWERYPQA